MLGISPEHRFTPYLNARIEYKLIIMSAFMHWTSGRLQKCEISSFGVVIILLNGGLEILVRR